MDHVMNVMEVHLNTVSWAWPISKAGVGGKIKYQIA